MRPFFLCHDRRDSFPLLRIINFPSSSSIYLHSLVLMFVSLSTMSSFYSPSHAIKCLHLLHFLCWQYLISSQCPGVSIENFKTFSLMVTPRSLRPGFSLSIATTYNYLISVTLLMPPNVPIWLLVLSLQDHLLCCPYYLK